MKYKKLVKKAKNVGYIESLDAFKILLLLIKHKQIEYHTIFEVNGSENYFVIQNKNEEDLFFVNVNDLVFVNPCEYFNKGIK